MASFWASTNSKPLELLAYGEDEAQNNVTRENYYVWSGYKNAQNNGKQTNQIRVPPKAVSDAAAYPEQQPVPLRPLYVQDPASSLLSSRFYTTAVRRFSVGGGTSCGWCWGLGV